MPVLDDRGRLFGKVNVIDAAVLAVLCLLIPLAYGAYLLFRSPPARIVEIVPSRVSQGTTQVQIRGENLRPYLRVTVDGKDAPLLFQNPAMGAITLPALSPGSHDIVLYDESQEIGRIPGGITVGAPPIAGSSPPAFGRVSELLVVGSFVALDNSAANALLQKFGQAGAQAATWGKVIAYRRPEKNLVFLQPGSVPVSDGTFRVRAVLQLRCALAQNQCRTENVEVSPGAILPLSLAGTTASFSVEEVHPVYTTAVTVELQAVLPLEVAALLKTAEGQAGDDLPRRSGVRPTIVSVTQPREDSRGNDEVVVTLRVPAVNTANGWMYRGTALRIGETFTLESPLYHVRGSIRRIVPE